MFFSSPAKIVLSAFLFLALLAVSWPVISNHPNVGSDNEALIDPLRTVHSLNDYNLARQSNQILDLAPIRDLSYWLELKVADSTGFENQQLDNLLLWAITVVCILVLLLKIGVRSPWAESLAILLLFHPVFTHSVYWKAGRKHLLSALFIVLATYALLSGQKIKNLTLSLIFYLIALGSQPINLGFPLFALIWRKRNVITNPLTIREGAYFAGLGLAGGACAWLNIQYYASDTFKNTGAYFNPKFRTESVDLMIKRLLIWGRDLYQILIPLTPSVFSYNLHSPKCIAGLIILIAAIVFGLRSRESLRWEWIVFLALPLFLMTAKVTSQGSMDTYLLTTLIGFVIFVGVTLKRFTTRPTYVYTATFLLWIVYVAIDYRQAEVWSNPLAFYTYGFEHEGGKGDKTLYARYALTHKLLDSQRILKIAEEVKSEDPRYLALGEIYGRAIYGMKVGAKTKEQLFEDNRVVQNPWYAYYWSAFDAQQGLFTQAHERLTKEWEKDPRGFYLTFNGSLKDLESKWLKMCELAKAADCDLIHQKIETQRFFWLHADRGAI